MDSFQVKIGGSGSFGVFFNPLRLLQKEKRKKERKTIADILIAQKNFGDVLFILWQFS